MHMHMYGLAIIPWVPPSRSAGVVCLPVLSSGRSSAASVAMREALYEPADHPATVWGLFVFFPAAFAAAGLAAFWMYRVRHPNTERMLLAGPRHQREAEYTPRPYCTYDLIASCGTGFLLNLGITIVVPVALASAETRGHSSPLTSSGMVAASTSIGMVVSVVLMYPWSASLMDSKLPALVFAALMLVGNLAFLGVEYLELPAPYLLGKPQP